MKIKRFNENQQYLTDPFDGEESVSYNIKHVYDSIEKNCKYIANKYNLDFKVKSQEISNNYSGKESRLFYMFSDEKESECWFYIWDDKPEIKIECFPIYEKERKILSDMGYEIFTWGDVDEYIKKFYKK